MTATEGTVAGTATEPAAGKRGFTFPTAFTILFGLLIVVAIATWIIPAGTYQFNADGAPIPGTYHEIASSPQDVFRSTVSGPINGMYGVEDAKGNVDVWNSGTLFGAVDVAMFVLIIGGFLGVTMKTGAIQAGIAWVVAKLRGKEKWLFPILMTIFAIGGTTYGMAEETLAFYALIITVMLAAGYDGLAAGALILLGAGIGVIGSTINPFATGIASDFAGTDLSAGLVGRLVLLVVGTVLGIVVRGPLRRAREEGSHEVAHLRPEGREREAVHVGRPLGERRVHRPAQAHPRGVPSGVRDHDLRRNPLGGSRALHPHVVVVVPGDDRQLPVLRGLDRCHRRMKEKVLVDTFIDGARDMLGVALIIALARGITVIMQNGHITDTVLHWAEERTSGLGGVAFILVMFLMYLALSFLIPSSSGLTTVSMPIMAPLAEFAGVSTALVVTAYQSANGLVNLVTPTSAVVMGGLAIARVGYGTWWRFVWPLVLLLAVLSMLVLGTGAVIS